MFSSRAQCKDGGAAFLSLLEVLGKRHSALLSLLWHGVVAAHAQCKEEASEYTGFQRHGNADTREQNSVPECLRQNLYEQLRKTIKMLKNDKKSKLKLKEQISVAFQLRLRLSKVLKFKTNSKVKLSKNMWLQTSDWHIPQQLSAPTTGCRRD